MGWRLFEAVVAAVISVAASCASAQDEGEAYRALVEEAVAEFDALRFEEARALFRRAHQLMPNARTLRGIGLASFEMRDYATAHRSLVLALASAERPLTDEQRAETTSVLERTRRFLGVLRIRIEPEGAALRLDGGSAPLEEDGTLLVGLGPHTVTARLEGYVEASRTVRIEGGEELELHIVMERLAPPSVPQPAPPPHDASSAIGLLVAGGGLALGSLVGVVLFWDRDRELGSCLDAISMGRLCTNESPIRLERDVAGVFAVTSAAVGIAGLVAGVVVLLLDQDAPSGRAWACLSGSGECAARF
ncbi:MAG: PEGA domain-containing protein [Sandaracinaceae bacterium]|nr:PEGA domain-containing protein [Sandaracinaceae bacterium]